MSDTTRPLEDYSRPTDSYREDLMTPSVEDEGHPLARINQPRVPGVFHIRHKNKIPAVSPQMSELLKLNDDSAKKPKVGVEVGFGPNRKEIMEMNQKLQRLGLLATQAGITIDVDGKSGKMVVELPPDLQGDQKKLEEALALEKEMKKRAPFASRFARLGGRIDLLLENSTLQEEQKNELDEFITSLEWLQEDTFRETDMTDEEITESLSQLENLIKKNEVTLALENEAKIRGLIAENEKERRVQQETLAVTKELSVLYDSFAELQMAIREMLRLISDNTLRTKVEDKRDYLLSIKKRVGEEMLPTKALVEEFKLAIEKEEQELGEIMELEKKNRADKEVEAAIEKAKRITIPKKITAPKQLSKEEKEKFQSLFDKYHKKNEDLEVIRDSFFGELTSELEKDMLIRRFTQLTNTNQAVQNALDNNESETTENLLKEYEEENTSVERILSMIQGRLTAIKTRAIHSLPAAPSSLPSLEKRKITLRPSSGINRDVTLRDGTKLASTPLQAAQKPQSAQKEIRSLQDVAERREVTDIFKLHDELFKKNNEEYLKVYLNKKWVSGDLNKEAVEKVIDNYRKSLLQKNEVITFSMGVKERELKLEKEKSKKDLIQIAINKLQEEIDTNIQKTKRIEGQIDRISNDIVLRHAEEKAARTQSIDTGRLIFSPSSVDKTAPYAHDGVVNPVQENTMATKEPSPISHLTGHFSGPDDTTSEEEPVPIKEESEPIKVTQEKKQGEPGEKSKKVTRLHETLTTLRTAKYGNKDWRVWASAIALALPLGGALGHYGVQGYENMKIKPNLTLLQAVSWKDYAELDPLKAFITDLV